jgi:hypothetical protein
LYGPYISFILFIFSPCGRKCGYSHNVSMIQITLYAQCRPVSWKVE